MRGTCFVLAALAGCGGSDPDVASSFEIVGLSVLSYTGVGEQTVATEAFLEGKSNL